MNTNRIRLLASAAVLAATVIHPAGAQPVTGIYVGAGAGGNFMQDENVSSTARVGGSTTIQTSPGRTTTNVRPPSAYGAHGSIPFDAGGVAVASVGYGFGNGLRAEVEGDYRYNSYSNSRFGAEQKFGGMLNVLYDLPFNVFGATPYAGLGAGYMWVDRDNGDRTDSFAYQAILGASFPIPVLPGLSATLEYRFMGLAGAEHRYVQPGYAYSSPGYSFTQDATTGKNKFNDDFNHSILIGLRYAFNAAPPPVVAPAPAAVPAQSAARTYLVFFDWDRADLTDRARQIIAEAARATTSVQVTRIEVNGYTDTSGTARYNQGLSIRRAQNVAAELVKDGVPRAAIATQGFGERNLLVQTGQGVREPQNRRVEIILR